MENIQLYRIEGCPFCEKVENKLEELDLDYEENVVPVRHSDRDKVHEISNQRAVPVISDPNPEDPVVGMNESDDIIEYLGNEYDEE